MLDRVSNVYHSRSGEIPSRAGAVMNGELFDAPFNLAGESQSSDLTAEGTARAKAEADAITRKAQLVFLSTDDARKANDFRSRVQIID